MTSRGRGMLAGGCSTRAAGSTRVLAPFLLLALAGCEAPAESVAPTVEPLASVRAGNDPAECPCICGFGYHCRFRVFPWLLEESQPGNETFELGIDVLDLRREWYETGNRGCFDGGTWAPIERFWVWVTYDPAMIELVEAGPGIDNAHWETDGYWIVNVGPFYDDPTRNLIGVASGILDDSQALTDPIMPGLLDRYRLARLVFRQTRQRGETWVRIFKAQDPMRCLGRTADLRLILSPSPSAAEGVER